MIVHASWELSLNEVLFVEDGTGVNECIDAFCIFILPVYSVDLRGDGAADLFE